VAVGTLLSTGGFIEEISASTIRSLEGISGGMALENGIKENVKGGFKTVAGGVAERPALSQQELPYLEKKIQQEATKQQTRQRTNRVLQNRRDKLTFKQNELENMAAKREATIATEEARLQAVVEQEQAQRKLLAEKNEASRLMKEAEAAQARATEEDRLRALEEEAKVKAREEAIAREQKALAILRQREEAVAQQRTAVSAGANALRDYVSRPQDYISNQPFSDETREKLQLLLKQLGLPPGIAGGVTATLFVGGSMIAIKSLIENAEESNDIAKEQVESNKNYKISNDDEDDLSSQASKLLAKKREESSRQPSNVRRTMKISTSNPQASKSITSSTNGTSEETPQSKVAPKPNEVDPGLPSNVASSTKKLADSAGIQTNSIFGAAPKQASAFGDSMSKVENKFRSTPPNPAKLPSKAFNSPFGAAPKQFAPNKQTASPFNSSTPSKPKSPAKKTINSFSVSKNQAAFGGKQTAFFGKKSPTVKTPGAFKAPKTESIRSPKGFGSPPNDSFDSFSSQKGSVSSTGSKQASPTKQPISPFDANSVGSTETIGSPFSKSIGSQNAFDSPPKKLVGSPSDEANSPFDRNLRNNFSSSSTQRYGSVTSNNKEPFSPFKQKNASQKKSKLSFSSSGPVYMPPTPKASNDSALNTVYSTLEKPQKKSDSRYGGTMPTSHPKKSFSPFGVANSVPKSPFSDSRSYSTPTTSSNNPDGFFKSNRSNASIGVSPGSTYSADQQSKKSFAPYGTNQNTSGAKSTKFAASDAKTFGGRGVKKSFLPYGRKPKQTTGNQPSVDPSSFSYGMPSKSYLSSSSVVPPDTSSFSFGSGVASSATSKFSSTNGVGRSSDLTNPLQSYGTPSSPQPFAATSFSSTVENNGHENDSNLEMERGRIQSLPNASNRAMQTFRDEQPGE